jgi:hypothetical protein
MLGSGEDRAAGAGVMFADREGAVYVNYCHQCGRALSSAQAERCERCSWLRCECGACGCNYEAPLSRPVLATVPPSWGGAYSRRAEAVPLTARPSRALPRVAAVVAVIVIAASVVAGARLLLLPTDEAVPPASTVNVAPAAPAPAAVPTTAPAAPAAANPLPESRPTAVSERASVVEAAPTPAPPAPTLAPTAGAAAAQAAPLYIANTGGEGAFRTQPRDAPETRIFAWRDGTPLVPLETRTVPEPNGSAVWVRVRDPRGQEGWIRQAYLTAAPR